MVDSGGTWKVGLLRDDEVGYSTEEMSKKEACFYGFLRGFMCLISFFFFCKKFTQGTVKRLVKDARSQPQKSPRQWARTSVGCQSHPDI
jgi:hypothetical protein